MEKNRLAYNKICDDWTDYRNLKPVNKCIVDFSHYLRPKAWILDVGCGNGYPISSYLSKSGFKVVGIDFAEKMIEKALKLNLVNAQFIATDFFNYETDIRFDAVIAFDSLWHIEIEKQEMIYSKISSLLKDGGYLLFTHGKKHGEIEGEMFKEKFYYSALDLDQVKRLLKENNLEIITLIENYQEITTGDRDLLIIAKKI